MPFQFSVSIVSGAEAHRQNATVLVAMLHVMLHKSAVPAHFPNSCRFTSSLFLSVTHCGQCSACDVRFPIGGNLLVFLTMRHPPGHHFSYSRSWELAETSSLPLFQFTYLSCSAQMHCPVSEHPPGLRECIAMRVRLCRYWKLAVPQFSQTVSDQNTRCDGQVRQELPKARAMRGFGVQP